MNEGGDYDIITNSNISMNFELQFQELARVCTQYPTNFYTFCRSLSIWINKPHVVNRRLCGAKLRYSKHFAKLTSLKRVLYKSSKSNSDHVHGKRTTNVISLHEMTQLIDEEFTSQCRLNSKVHSDTNKTEEINNKAECSNEAHELKLTKEQRQHSHLMNCDQRVRLDIATESLSIDVSKLYKENQTGYVLVIRDLYPRETNIHPVIREVVIFDFHEKAVSFLPLCTVRPPIGQKNCQMGSDITQIKRDDVIDSCNAELSYQFQFHEDFENSSIALSTHRLGASGKTQLSEEWLQMTLLKKLVSWCNEPDLNTDITSLRLVALDEYSAKYQHLKLKYGTSLVKVWPECTDPQKFVYEDVAIATYLLLLWETERRQLGQTRKQSFVDLGCGNGLLVYLLASEGHNGVGLDIRRRKIWDMFSGTADLREETVLPSSDNLFPQYDWLIGNHSDELTPWIPVIAARSSYTTRFFVLPCCPHDFDHKFTGKLPGRSVYESYLEFVGEVARTCGFTVHRDTLRIPSTKRVCLVGWGRSYEEQDEAGIDVRREEYIQGRCVTHGAGHTTGDSWASTFVPRPKTEKVRNCQTLDKALKDHVVNTVFDAVLRADNSTVCEKYDGRLWRKGGVMSVVDAVALFDPGCLQQMKHECGGLQTLLRNKHSVFQVSKGTVALRDLTLAEPWGYRSRMKKAEEKSAYRKTSLCWFYENHPDGCVLKGEDCSFAHGVGELTLRPG